MKKRRPHVAQPDRPVATGSAQPISEAQSNAAKLDAALAMHQQGRLDLAEALYKEILQSEPRHFDALQFLATIAAQRKDSAAAVELFDQALKINPTHASSLNNRGIALSDLQRFDEALESYDRALGIRPDYAEALNNRGGALIELTRLDEALESCDRALKIKPDYAEALNNRGSALRGLNRPDEALESCNRALKIRPDYAEAHFNRGNALVDLKRSAGALESYDRALRIRPDYAEALYNRGVALQGLERREEALESYDRALRSYGRELKINPDYAKALNNCGLALEELDRIEEALESYDRALNINPDYAEALNNRGNVLRDLKRFDEALETLDRALTIEPNYAGALNNRGNALRDLKRLDEALESYDRALAIKPDNAGALNNRGVTLSGLKRFDEALETFDRVLRIKPDYVEAHYNRGVALQALHRVEEALESYDRALKINPDYADAQWNESLCRLLMGDFALGWQKHEWRWKKELGIGNPRNFEQPLWLGKEDLENKTILLHSEQGLGDTIQFCRYARQTAQLGAKVILEVQPPLKTLLKDLEGAAMVFGRGENLPDFDYHCPLLSLPLAFKTDLSNITNSSYLKSDRQKIEAWESRLNKHSKKRVGLVWSGSTGHQNDHNRSIAFEEFKTLVNDHADYYCLQKELRSADKAVLEQAHNIRFLGDELKDFSDTAALVELMDLVITIDTSVAHLAGAMGKEVWILLPFNPDWRWLLGRSDSPWYQSARLFRQPRIGDWQSVLVDVKTLANLGYTRHATQRN